MNKFYLSTSRERTTGIIFSVAAVAALIALLFALRDNRSILVIAGAGVALVVLVLLLYILNVSKAACIVDFENQVLRVTGFQERTIDLTQVVALQTITVKTGQVEGRSLAFTNEKGVVVASVPTYFTSNRGIQAEPMAKELAKVLNIEFIANVPVWEYDAEARKQHEIEVAKQEKEDAKARREGRKALMQAKIRKRMEESRQENTKENDN